MAKSQTRRSVSLNRAVYAAALAAAHARGKSLSELVTDSLRASGVAIPETTHFSAEHSQRAAEGRLSTPEERQEKERARSRKRYRSAVLTKSHRLKPGPIRKALGDSIANAMGEPMWKEAV